MTNNSVHDSFGTKLNPMASSTTNSKISNGSIEKLMKPPLPKKVPNDGMNIDMETFNRAETGYVIDTTCKLVIFIIPCLSFWVCLNPKKTF